MREWDKERVFLFSHTDFAGTDEALPLAPWGVFYVRAISDHPRSDSHSDKRDKGAQGVAFPVRVLATVVRISAQAEVPAAVHATLASAASLAVMAAHRQICQKRRLR